MARSTSTAAHGEITRALLAVNGGDHDAVERLWHLVYGRLHQLAQRHQLHPGDLLHQTTDIVHAAYERLVDQRKPRWENHSHFFAVASRFMRYVAVDWARAAGRDARRRDRDPREPLAESSVDPAELVDLEEALSALEAREPRCARVVELRYFGGLTLAEIAAELEVSTRTAEGDWAFSRAWLRRRLTR